MTSEERYQRQLKWLLLAEVPCLLGIVALTILAIWFRELNSLYYGPPLTVIGLGGTWLLCRKAPHV